MTPSLARLTPRYGFAMAMNVSLPDDMRRFVEEQVHHGRYDSSGEYLRDLIQRDQSRGELRRLLLDGRESGPARPADEVIQALRVSIRR